MINPVKTTMTRTNNTTQGTIKDNNQTHITFTMHHDQLENTIITYEDTKTHTFKTMTYKNTAPLSGILTLLNIEALKIALRN